MWSGEKTFFILCHFICLTGSMCFAPFTHLSQLSCAASLLLALPKARLAPKSYFEAAAPVAMGIDSELRSDLIAIAKNNGWAKPVAEKSAQKELADNEGAGGSVHMQSLMPVNQSLDGASNGLYFAGSSTVKTVASKY